MAGPSFPEDRVLILAPTGRDASLMGEMLQNGDLKCHNCSSVEEIARTIGEGAGLAIVAEEALVGVSIEPLVRALSEQPAWSDFPLLFLSNTGTRASKASTALLRMFGSDTNLTILERPVRVATLLSGVRSALRARRRQYQVRDYLRDLKRSEKKLLQTQKLESLGVLAGGIAHDFNNLLTGILGNASLAIESLPPKYQDVHVVLQDVVDASERAAHLTKQLLAYAGKGKFVVEPVNLSDMARSVTHLLQAAMSKNARLRLELAEGLPSVEADAAQLQQIIMNLVINAGESIPPDRTGQVVLTTSFQEADEEFIRSNFPGSDICPGSYVALEVSDNGAGMSESTIAKIFDPFFTTKFTGRGLGLAAVQGIVRGHKGALKVQSTLGEGSNFRILFPSIEAPARSTRKKSAPSKKHSGNGLNVLVIDDEEVVRKTAAAALRLHGYDSLLASDGPEGIKLFEAERETVSLVLLDLTMPGMGGEEVFRRLKAIQPDVKIILSSGFNESEVVQRFEGKSLGGFIQKPYSAGALVEKVNVALAPGKITGRE